MTKVGPEPAGAAADREPLRSSRSIQGNILAPFNKPHQAFLFFNFRNDPKAARAWLAGLVDGVATTADVHRHNREYREYRKAKEPKPKRPTATWTGISLTSSGLVILEPGLAADLVAYEAFWHGPLIARRQPDGTVVAPFALVGDEAHHDARAWVVGGPGQPPVDALVTVAADDEAELDKVADDVRGKAEGLLVLKVGPGEDAPEEQRGTSIRGPNGGVEHFGFRDGVSQPGIRGYTRATIRNGRWESERQPGSPIIAAGEFVLGQPRERGSYPRGRRPSPPRWAVDGAFQVWARLIQDVAGWRDQMTRLGGALSDDLAAKAIGRRPDGTALASGGGGQRLNDFTYADDPHGLRTPLFSHARTSNPRRGLPHDDRTHRMLRRGIPFGQPLADHPAAAGSERGLVLNAFMASIEDQFEFLQRVWANSPDGPDPLVGAGPGPWMLRRDDEEPVRLDLRRFVRATGLVYGFAPSIPTLHRLAGTELGGQPVDLA